MGVLRLALRILVLNTLPVTADTAGAQAVRSFQFADIASFDNTLLKTVDLAGEVKNQQGNFRGRMGYCKAVCFANETE